MKIWQNIKYVCYSFFIIIAWSILVATIELSFEYLDPSNPVFLYSYTYLIITWLLSNIIMVVVVIYFSKKTGILLKDFNFKINKKLIIGILFGLIIYFISNFLIVLSSKILPIHYPFGTLEGTFWIFSSTTQQVILSIFIVFIIPIVEEFYFRGFIYMTLRKNKNFFYSSLVTTIIFLLFYPVLILIPSSILISLVLCYFYEKYSNLLIPMTIRIIINLLWLINLKFKIISMFDIKEIIF